MGFKQEIYAHYVDKDGLVTIDRDPTPNSTLNGLTYLGLFITRLAVAGELEIKDVEHFEKVVRSCYQAVGLLNRAPGVRNLNGWDDYNSVCAASYFTGSPFARDILQWGAAHEDRWNNEDLEDITSLRAWITRRPGLKGLFELCAHQTISNTGITGLCMMLRFLSDEDKTHENSKFLSWMQVQVMKREGIAPEVCQAFEYNLQKTFGGIGGCFAAYCGKPDHPLSREDAV